MEKCSPSKLFVESCSVWVAGPSTVYDSDYLRFVSSALRIILSATHCFCQEFNTASALRVQFSCGDTLPSFQF